MAVHLAPRDVASSIRSHSADARRQLEERRRGNRVVDAAFRAIQLDREAGGTLLAGAIAFRFFVFLIPCVFLLVTGFGLGADAAGADPREAARHAGVAGLAAVAIQSGEQASTVTRWVTFVVAGFAVMVGARNLVRVLAVSHALIWKVPFVPPRHAARAGVALVGFAAVTVAMIRLVAALRSVSLLGWLVGLVLFSLIPAGVWLLGSAKLFPARPGVTWTNVLPGALVFGVGVEALHLVTVLWISRSIESKSETYGAIGAALTLLAWAYLLGRIVTAAATVNAAVWTGRERQAAVARNGGPDGQ